MIERFHAPSYLFLKEHLNPNASTNYVFTLEGEGKIGWGNSFRREFFSVFWNVKIHRLSIMHEDYWNRNKFPFSVKANIFSNISSSDYVIEKLEFNIWWGIHIFTSLVNTCPCNVPLNFTNKCSDFSFWRDLIFSVQLWLWWNNAWHYCD